MAAPRVVVPTSCGSGTARNSARDATDPKRREVSRHGAPVAAGVSATVPTSCESRAPLETAARSCGSGRRARRSATAAPRTRRMIQPIIALRAITAPPRTDERRLTASAAAIAVFDAPVANRRMICARRARGARAFARAVSCDCFLSGQRDLKGFRASRLHPRNPLPRETQNRLLWRWTRPRRVRPRSPSRAVGAKKPMPFWHRLCLSPARRTDQRAMGVSRVQLTFG